jgi:16S rRNA (uracil1498-N3)-methyltransferase
MARRLFFVPEVRSGRAELRGEDAKHLTRVLRVETGHTYEISDNQQRYLARVSEAHKEAVRFDILERLPSEPEVPEIHLYAALIKFEHFEWGIEKATELGVSRIIPMQTARTEPGLEKAVAKRLERWRKIALESSQQCRRAFLPVLEECSRFREVISRTQGMFLDEARTGEPLQAGQPTGAISIAIGPEGGWTEDERNQALAASWKPVSLGPRVLRAETAWMASLAILRHQLP